jgi:hypothetical protein
MLNSDCQLAEGKLAEIRFAYSHLTAPKVYLRRLNPQKYLFKDGRQNF